MPDRHSVTELPLRELVQRDRPITYGIVQPGQFVPDGVLLVRGRDYSSGWRPVAEMVRVTPAIEYPYRRARLRSGDLLMTIVGAGTGNTAVVPDYLDGANITQTTARIGIDASKADPAYVLAVLRSEIGQNLVYKHVKGGAQPGLNIGDIGNFHIPIPPMAIQQRVASISGEWEAAIRVAEELAVAKRRFLDRLRHKLIGRAPIGRASPRLMRDVVEPVVRRNDGADHPIMTISSTEGFILQSDRYDRHMAGESLETYTLLRRGEFSYNRGNSNTYPWGCIFRLDESTAVVPSIYFSFALREGLDAVYMDHFFRSGALNQQLRALVSSSARLNGLLNISRADFYNCRLAIPDLAYQQAAGGALAAAERDHEITVARVDALRRQRRGLMQKLLTGDWRAGEATAREAAE